VINGLTVEVATGPVGASVLTVSHVPMPIRTNTATAAVNKVILRMCHLYIQPTIPPEESREVGLSQFHVADAASLLARDPISVLYVATVLAQRLDSANRALVLLKSQLQDGQPHSVVAKTVEKMEELLAASGASLVYAGYPTDPFA
jgi:hypothetical protein